MYSGMLFEYNMNLMRKVFTLAIVVKDGNVLLGEKQQKLGAGLWNGFGGKVEPGEDIQEAAMRECYEEIGIIPTHIQQCGLLFFHHEQEQLGTKEHECHLFLVKDFKGEPKPTEEMQNPTWFLPEEIPYDNMWQDDKHWMPLVLAGEYFEGNFWFSQDLSLVKWNIREKARRS